MSEEENANANQSQDNTEGGGSDGGKDQGNQGGDKGTVNPFLESLPEGIRDFEGFKDIADVGALATKYADMVNGLPVVPDKPEAYEIAIPEGLTKDENFLTGFKGVAHQAKLTQEQVKTMSDWWNGVQLGVIAQQGKNQEDATTALRGEWKGDFDKNMKSAKKALKRFGGDELTAYLEQTRLGDSPILIKAFKVIGDAISEDSFVKGQNKPQQIKRTAGGTPVLNFPSMDK